MSAQAIQAYGNGIWVAIDDVGHIMTSIDGITWPTYAWPQNAPAPFLSVDAHWSFVGIAFGGDHFVAYGKAIVIIGSGLPGTEWLSSLVKGGVWNSATFTGSNWILTDDAGRTATSEGTYPANWNISRL